MTVSSLRSQVDRVQSLLSSIQDSLIQAPFEFQNQVLQDLERVVFEFRSVMQADHQPFIAPAFTSPTFSFEPKYPSNLQAQEPWVGHAMRQANSGAWNWDLVQDTLRFSPELFDLLGFGPEDGISSPETFFEMILVEDRDRKLGEVKEVLARGGPFYLEFHVRCKDGRTRWISSVGSVEQDPSGRPVQASGICQDISVHKRTEYALREAEERERAKLAELEALMDAVPAMIWISRDPQCREMVGNRYGYEFLGMWEGANISRTAPDVDLTQQTYRNFKDGKEIPDHELPMQAAAAAGVGTSNYEFDLVFQDGVTKNLLGNVVPLHDPQGNPSGVVGAFVDITERKRMEAELRQNEAQLRRWREQINIWSKATSSFFWVLEPDGSYQKQGATVPYITGKSFDQTRNWKWLDSIHPDDREELRIRWQQAFQNQTLITFEARVWNQASNQYRWYSHQAVPVLEEGVLKEWVGASIDIQARKEMIQALHDREAELRRSEANERARAAELQAIIDAVPTPILLADDPAGEGISGNLAAYKFLGIRPGENLAKILQGEDTSYIETVNKDGVMLPREEIPLQIALRTGEAVKDFEGTVVFKDGRQKILLGNATPLRDPGGSLSGAVGVFVDITERVSAERALRENEQRFRVALASAPLTVFTLDKDLRYTWVHNSRHSLKDSELIGKRGDEILPAEDVREFTELKQNALETGKSIQREIKVKINGTWLYHIVSIDPIFNRQGVLTGLVGATLDISKQRRLETAQRESDIRLAAQSQLLETREKERVKISRDIHDGPIQSIIGAIFHVQDLKDRLVDGDVKDDLEPVRTSLKNAVQELRQIINELRPPLLDRYGLIRAIERLVEEAHEKFAQVEISLDLQDEAGNLPDLVNITLFRICQEALSNIVRHSEATRSTIRLSFCDDQIDLVIHDNGKGFENTVDFTTLTENSHYGLVGMKERAEALGGNFLVTSTPEDGTTIEVRIPSGS